MIENILFIAGLGVFLTLMSSWGFKVLPREKWQVLGTIPIVKTANGHWKGLNLTYYGLFNGIAVMIASAIMMVLLGAVSTPISAMILFMLGTMVFAAPATKIVAYIVERKPCTLSVAGASFIGILVAPWIAMGVKTLFEAYHLGTVHIIVLLAAVSNAYAFGEGIGRLSCISFGCCYGKPVDQLPGFLRKIFHHVNFVFQGKTKKISYAHQLEGKQILPIQGITSIIYFIAGLVGVFLFLQGYFMMSFIITLSTTQIWRVISEFLRADYRGTGKLSVYQYMALITVPYAIAVSFLFRPDFLMSTHIGNGLSMLWNPTVILFLQGLLLAVFLFTGRSKVITAELSFHVRTENI